MLQWAVSKLQSCASGSPVAQKHNGSSTIPSTTTTSSHLICILLAPPSQLFIMASPAFFWQKRVGLFAHSFLCKLVSGYNRLLRWRIKNIWPLHCKDDWVKHFDTVCLRSEISIHLSFHSVNGWFPAALQNYWYWSDFLTGLVNRRDHRTDTQCGERSVFSLYLH